MIGAEKSMRGRAGPGGRRTRRLTAVAGAVVVLATTASAAAAQGGCGNAVTVRPGDTFYSIAEQCGTSVEALQRANPGVDMRDLTIGSEIAMPVAGDDVAKPGAGDDVADAPPASRGYEVRPGDTLYSVAELLGVTVDAILDANPGLDPAALPIGTIIRPPGRTQPGEPSRPIRERITISPARGTAGTDVTVTVKGFPAGSLVEIGGGPPASEYTVRERGRVGTDGAFSGVIRVPEHAARHDTWVIVATTADGRHEAKARFAIAEGDDDDGISVTGTLTETGVECQAMRGTDGRLYTLVGDLEGFESGDRVYVEGEVPDASICMQGTTIEVETIASAG